MTMTRLRTTTTTTPRATMMTRSPTMTTTTRWAMMTTRWRWLRGGRTQDGTPDHYIGESLRVDFDLAAEDAVVLLTTGNDDSGEVIGGEQLWLTETRLRFSPTRLLEPNTAYTAVVTWAEGAETYSWGFTTGDTGSIPVAADMVGNTYSLAVADGTVVAPAGAEDLLGQFDATFLLGVVSGLPPSSAARLDGRGGMLDQTSAFRPLT